MNEILYKAGITITGLWFFPSSKMGANIIWTPEIGRGSFRQGAEGECFLTYKGKTIERPPYEKLEDVILKEFGLRI